MGCLQRVLFGRLDCLVIFSVLCAYAFSVLLVLLCAWHHVLRRVMQIECCSAHVHT
jgi:hypothetical protein